VSDVTDRSTCDHCNHWILDAVMDLAGREFSKFGGSPPAPRKKRCSDKTMLCETRLVITLSFSRVSGPHISQLLVAFKRTFNTRPYGRVSDNRLVESWIKRRMVD